MKCSKCNHENGEKTKFCESCGEALSVKCPECGTSSPPTTKFCENCGHKFASAAVQPTPAPLNPTHIQAPLVDASITPEPRGVDQDAVSAPPQALPSKVPVTPEKINQLPVPPPNVEPVTSLPSLPSEKKKSHLGLIAALVVAAGGIGAFMMLSSSIPPVVAASASPPILPEAPASAVVVVASKPAEEPPKVVNVAAVPVSTPVEASTPSDESAKFASESMALAKAPLDEISKAVDNMLTGSKDGSDALINEGFDQLKAVPKSEHGDRKKARSLNDEGLKALQQQDLPKAIKSFASAYQSDFSDQECINNLAFALHKAKKNEEAKLAIMLTLSLDPSRSAAWANLGTIFAEGGNPVAATSAFLLAYRYSKSPQKTREFLQGLAKDDPSQHVKDAASTALSKL